MTNGRPARQRIRSIRISGFVIHSSFVIRHSSFPPMFDDLSDLYQQVILDHSKSPRNFRVLPDANRTAQGTNPICGDNYTLYARMDGDVVKEISFQGSGCAISKASA